MPRGEQLCYSDASARSANARIVAAELEPEALVVLDSATGYEAKGRISTRIRIELPGVGA